jgi:hypothetical protein
MTHGKNICKQLKEVRKRIAEENNIPLEIEECTYKGECRGTCPRCEAEVRYLENALAERLRIGKVATVAGLALGLAATAQAQAPASPSPQKDTIAKIEYLPLIQCTDVDAYKLMEENTGKARGEDGSVVLTGMVRKRTMPPPDMTLDTLQTKFRDDNGTPARQTISTEPPKMYEEKEEDVKVIVR